MTSEMMTGYQAEDAVKAARDAAIKRIVWDEDELQCEAARIIHQLACEWRENERQS